MEQQDQTTVLKTIEKMLVDSINDLQEAYEITMDYNEDQNKEQLISLVEKFDQSLCSMNEYCSNVPDEIKKELTIPEKVLTDLDDGYKPDSYGKDKVDEFRNRHQLERIRSEGFAHLFNFLCAEIKEQLDPELAENIISEGNREK
ncbi:Mediator of RNA polymerase II transcription subunit 10 [Entamoeba marina]